MDTTGNDDQRSNTISAPLSTMASAMMFGSIISATVALACRSAMLGDYRCFQAARSPRSSPLDVRSYSSVYTLLQHLSFFGMILFYAYICENHPPYSHAGKHYDADQFFFLTALLFVVSAFTIKNHDVHSKKKPTDTAKSRAETTELVSPEISVENGLGHASPDNPRNISAIAEPNDVIEILNRDQTEEWKGWMQFMFLLYHYYHAEEVYNAIRIMITCYVWMTGFGNFSFFYLKADYSWVRVLQMLWRLNFLVLFLSLTQGTNYILYYICLLHTYYFLLVYATMRIGCERNHTKWWIRIKLAVLALIIYIIWDVDSGMFQVIHYPFFGTAPKLGATNGSMWEWYFRSSLDHWSTFLGMTFALNFPILSLFFRKLEAQPLVWHVLAKTAMGLALASALWIWVVGPFQHNKFEYNQTNAYFGFIPMIAYIYFRNLTPGLRCHSMELLHQIGKTTLETYLMQHHIWLTSNAKSLLTLVPGWPKVNFLLVSLIYVFLSRRLYQLTLFLRGMILPDDGRICFRNLAVMGGAIFGHLAIAFSLEIRGLLNLQMVGIVSLLCGMLLYQCVVNMTHASQETVQKSDRNVAKTEDSVDGSFWCRYKDPLLLSSPSLSGAVVILLLGSVWSRMAMNGASRIRRLPRTCSSYANLGSWIPIDGCDEGYRGGAYRKYGIAPASTCSVQNSAYVWGWTETPSSSHCRFSSRDPKSLQRTLQDRTLTFIGDSITRYLYFSFCRQMGLSTVGAYNATGEKHVDMRNDIGKTGLEFQWAPFVSDQIKKVKEISELSRSLANGGKKRPDLIMLGGGAWDRLHFYNDDVEKSALKKNLDELATAIQELRSMEMPVVWLIPTTINTQALPTDQKRENISEEEVEHIRSLYESQGVLSSCSFVVDGPGFTRDRVAESYDGVHYPHSVYTAGAQILANSLDWLIDEAQPREPADPPHPGSMAHPQLGLMMLCFVFFGLFGFDGFLGFSYLVSLFVPSVSPKGLYYEAFTSLHRRKNLPEIIPNGSPHLARSPSCESSLSSSDLEEEVISLLNKES